jgi:branched-chain amino acid aminotransferase
MHAYENDIVYLNGNFLRISDASISPKDRGLLLGDGIFETILYHNTKLEFLSLHWERFHKSAAYLKIPLAIQFEELETCIYNLIALNNLQAKTASIRITLTRGISERGILPPITPSSTLLITANEYKPIDKYFSLIVTKIVRNECSPTTSIKTTNYIDNILARMEAADKGADDAVILNTKQNIAETSIANLFLVKHGTVYTPPISDGALPGIIRAVILNACMEHQIPCSEKTITISDLMGGDEIFLTNSLMGIKKVTTLGKKEFSAENSFVTDRLIPLINTKFLG